MAYNSELYDLPEYGGDAPTGVMPFAMGGRSPFVGSAELENYSPLGQAKRAAASVTNTPKAGQVLTQSVPAQQAAQGAAAAGQPPMSPFDAQQAEYAKNIAAYRDELKGYREPPDYSQLQEKVRQRAMGGLDLARASIAAGMGPQDMRGLQPHLFQQAQASMAPQKIEGGQISASGELELDPGFQRAKRIEALRDDINALEKLKQTSFDAKEKRDAEAKQQQLMLDLRREIAHGNQQIAAGNLALRKEIADAKREGGQLSTKDRAQIEDRMADDYNALTKGLREEQAAIQKIRAITNPKPNAIEQQTMMVLLNKFLDPTSVVREGEFDRVAKAQGLVDRATMIYDQVAKGTPLSPALVKDIRAMAELYDQASRQRLEYYRGDYGERATRRGLDPRNVVGLPPQAAPSPAPADKRTGGDRRADPAARQEAQQFYTPQPSR